MANQSIDIQINYNGRNPIVPNMRLALLNIWKLVFSIAHGSHRKAPPGTSSWIQAQSSVVAATGTITPSAVQAGDTVTVAGQALTATQQRASGTITCASAVANDTITINGVTFTGVNGAVVLGEATFDIRTGDTQTATSIVAQVGAYASPLLSGIVELKSAAGVVTVYAKTPGTAGNSITLASSSNTTLAVSGANLANGAAVANNQFDYIGTDIETGASISAAINNSTTAAVKQFTATYSTSTGVVTAKSKVAGIAGNGLTLTSSSNTRLAVSGSGFFTGGSAGAVTRWYF